MISASTDSHYFRGWEVTHTCACTHAHKMFQTRFVDMFMIYSVTNFKVVHLSLSTSNGKVLMCIYKIGINDDGIKKNKSSSNDVMFVTSFVKIHPLVQNALRCDRKTQTDPNTLAHTCGYTFIHNDLVIYVTL